MSNEITPGYDAATAERVIKEYADDVTTYAVPSLTDRECAELEINSENCDVLQESLGWGAKGIVTDKEQEQLSLGGFAKEFIATIAGNDGKRALQARVKWLSKHLIRKGAMEELQAIGPDAKDLIPKLRGVLKNRGLDPFYRGRAALVLGSTGSEYIISDLVAALEDDNEDVCEYAAIALENMRQKAIPLVAKVLEEGAAKKRSRAAAVLVNIDTPAIPFVRQVLENGKPMARCYAAWVLGRMSHVDKSTISALKTMARSDRCWPCQGVAERALEKLGKKTDENGF